MYQCSPFSFRRETYIFLNVRKIVICKIHVMYQKMKYARTKMEKSCVGKDNNTHFIFHFHLLPKLLSIGMRESYSHYT